MSDKSQKSSYDGFREILFLIDYLVEHSGRQHKLSQAELIMALQRYKDVCSDDPLSSKVYSPQVRDGIPDRVKRFLENFTGEKLLNFLELCESEEDFKGPANSAKKYYLDGPLSDRTVCILRDAISVYPYAEQNTTKKIINELNSLTSIYNRPDYDYYRNVEAQKFPGSYYENLQEIYKALSTSKEDSEGEKLLKKDYDENYREYERKKLKSKEVSRLRFEYCRYSYDKANKKFELTVRKTRNGRPERTVNPLRLLWSNGYYYLVTYYISGSEYHYINYRVDRMKNVVCLDEPAQKYEDSRYGRFSAFDPQLYKTRNPVMFTSGGRGSDIRIRCRTYILNNVIDTFGFGIDVLSYDEKDDGFMEFRVKNTAYEGVIMWALEYSRDCEILEPPELRRRMAEYGRHLENTYSVK